MYLIIILHFLSDWIFQPRAVAKRKSSSLKWMSIHLIIIYVVFSIYAYLFNISNLFVLVNTFSHGIIDFTIWRGFEYFRGPFDSEYLKYNKYAEDYWFYFTIGIDQILHLCILIFLFKGEVWV